jgi:hypothetical protein
MDHMTMGVGDAWILLSIGAALVLGTEFVLHEIHSLLRRRRDPEAE